MRPAVIRGRPQQRPSSLSIHTKSTPAFPRTEQTAFPMAGVSLVMQPEKYSTRGAPSVPAGMPVDAFPVILSVREESFSFATSIPE